MKKKNIKRLVVLITVLLTVFMLTIAVSAEIGIPGIPESAGEVGASGIEININGEGSGTVRIILMMTLIALVPSMLIMMTCFTRIIVVFSLLRNAIGLQQTPPNQVLIGLALFLTFFVMSPILTEINETAYQPYSEGEISTQEFLDTAKVPLRDFMLRQTKEEDMGLFLNISGRERPASVEEYTMDVVIPAFITSELKRAFTIGFFLFIPFLIVDMVVASALMSMGMVMLPPATISLPFKLLLFVMVDGWSLLIKTLVATYQ